MHMYNGKKSDKIAGNVVVALASVLQICSIFALIYTNNRVAACIHLGLVGHLQYVHCDFHACESCRNLLGISGHGRRSGCHHYNQQWWSVKICTVKDIVAGHVHEMKVD